MSEEKCPICGNETEDIRHVGVECFYNVLELVPDAKENRLLREVDRDGVYWGITRTYPEGTIDSFSCRNTKREDGTDVTEIDRNQIPQKGGRFIEESVYSICCCKDCRGDFLRLFKEWRNGKHISDCGEGEIPIRENGAIKYITEKEWCKRNAEGVKNED